MTRLGGTGLVVLIALTAAGAGGAAEGIRSPGDLDYSFGREGRADLLVGDSGGAAVAAVLQPDAKVVFGGYTGYLKNFLVTRLNVDGSPDRSFGGDGIVETSVEAVPGGRDGARAVALGPGGSIVLAGITQQADEQWTWALARYRPNGALDTSFSADGRLTLSLRGPLGGLAVQPDGRMIVAGTVEAEWTVVRLRADGTLDPTFGSNGIVRTSIGYPSVSDSPVAVHILQDGRILIGGQADGTDFALARYLANGQLDASFGTNGLVKTPTAWHDVVTDLALLPNGRIVAVGFDQSNDPAMSHFRLARYLPNGTLDASFGNGGLVITDFPDSWEAHAYSVSLQADGKLLLAGDSEPDYWYQELFALARYNPDGSLDASFGDGGTRVYHLACDGSPGYAAVLQPVPWGTRVVQGGRSSCYGRYAVSVIGVETAGPPWPQGAYRVQTRSGQPIVPGTTRIDDGVCNECTITVELPWTVWVYGIPYRRAHVSTNGNVQFSSNSPSSRRGCVPFAALGTSVMAHWGDLYETGSIWTGLVGGSPRRFVIEWRARMRWEGTANFEVVFTEGSPTVSVVYGESSGDDAYGRMAVAGIQRGGGDVGVSFACGGTSLVPGLAVDYVWDGELAPPPPPRPPLPPPPAPPAQCVVPRVVGQKLQRARKRIRARHCRVGRIRRARSARARGRVLRQRPKPGARRARGTRVHLVVSRGRG